MGLTNDENIVCKLPWRLRTLSVKTMSLGLVKTVSSKSVILLSSINSNRTYFVKKNISLILSRIESAAVE